MNREIALQETYLPTNYSSYYDFGRKVVRGLQLCDVGRDLLSEGKDVTLNTDYLAKGYHPKDQNETPYKEIYNQEISYKVPNERFRMLSKQRPFTYPFDECVNALKESIRGYIIKLWDTDAPKIFLHSAGYDSRIISGILVELREEKGEDWIGDLHFRCHQPEGELFKQIMVAEGWKESQYSLWEDVKSGKDHYNVGRLDPVNGFMSFIQQYDFFSDLTKGREKEVIIIGGIYGGELFDYPARGKKHFKDFKYCDNEQLNSLHNYMLYEGGTVSKYFDDHNYAIFPFLSYDYLEIATRMPKKFITRDKNQDKTRPDRIRTALLKSFDFDIYSIPYGRHDYQWDISKKTWFDMEMFYQKSIFFRETEIKLKFPFKIKSYDDMMWGLALNHEYIHNPEL